MIIIIIVNNNNNNNMFILYSAFLTLKVALQSQGNTTEQQEIQQNKWIKALYIDLERV